MAGNPPADSGPQWLHDFLVAKAVPMPARRVLWALAMRESRENPACLYPHAPSDGDWGRDTSPYWDTGLWQINNRHCPTIREIYGRARNMALMLDPEFNFDYTYNHLSNKGTNFLDWGVRATATGFVFDWSSYPRDWVAKNGPESEKNFKYWYDLWPAYDKAAVHPAPKPTPKPAPKPAPKPVLVQLTDVQPGDRNRQVKVVQAALAAEGLRPGAIDGMFGKSTTIAYALWQRRLGYSGHDADGAPGRASLTALGKKHGFTVL